ncbi:MAG TPA: GNAT family N-acyltransferase, partial [Polyangiaceae bacterium]
ADAFDDHYHHLVLFDNERQCVAGAYRLAFCDEVLATRGLAGLYTSQLFRYRAGMQKELRSAIEMGRSFVAPEYQRQSSALALLWRGIGEILVRNPRYRRLIGPVSISEQYRGSVRRLLLAYLRAQHGSPALAKLVEPKRPAEVELTDPERVVLIRACRNRREFGRTMESLNGSLRPLPVLLERYLDLGGKVAAFSVDSAFNHCIDALITVDVDRAPQATLRRFLGATGHAEFASYGARVGEVMTG